MQNKRPFKTELLIIAAAFCAVFFMASSAFAGDNDLRLEMLCNGQSQGCGSQQALDDFGTLSKAYGAIFSPTHLMPASTLGEEGFEISVESKMSFAMDKDSSWKAVRKNYEEAKNEVLHPSAEPKEYSAPDIFASVQLHMRKGLPFSLEVEGNVSWLANSELFFIGAGLRWAVTEGWDYVPDISVRANVGTLVGAAQLSLINVNLDATISYTWGLGGICAITPYGGYSFLYTSASSRPLVVVDSSLTGTVESVFGRRNLYQHRGFVGLQLQGDYFVFGVEGEFAANVMGAAAKIGAKF